MGGVLMASLEWVGGNSAGAFTSTVDKLGVHTTEGRSIESAIAAYRANNSWPHDTVDFRFGHPYRICRHLGYNVAARSFKNLSGGVQTNTDGVIQVEVVGSATSPGEIDWAAFGRDYVGPICRANHIPISSTVHWVAYPASYGVGASQRLSASGWTNYRGILGHQHVPENSHGDPGAIPILVVLRSADLPKPPPPTEEDMPYILGHPNGTGYLVDGGVVTFLDGNSAGRYQDAGIATKSVALNDAGTADLIVANGNVGARLAALESQVGEILELLRAQAPATTDQPAG